MSLGQLGLHIAQSLEFTSQLVLADGFEAQGVPQVREIDSAAALPHIFDESVEKARKTLRSFDDAAMTRPWKLTRNGATLIDAPRETVIRGIMFNHLYHHRGQLTVYLRLLDIPVPSIYGPSADESRF